MNVMTVTTIAGRIDVTRTEGGVTLNCGPVCLVLKTRDAPTLDALLPIATHRLAHGDVRPLYMDCGAPGSPLLRIFAGIREELIYITHGPFVLRLSMHDCEPLADAIVTVRGATA